MNLHTLKSSQRRPAAALLLLLLALSAAAAAAAAAPGGAAGGGALDASLIVFGCVVGARALSIELPRCLAW
jgi:hypothetical protein